MADKYWRSGDMYYVGSPFAGAVEIAQEEFEAHQHEVRMQMIRNRRDELIANIAWRYERNAREQRLNIPLSDSLESLDTYIQALCDIPKQIDFPNHIIWPTLEQA